MASLLSWKVSCLYSLWPLNSCVYMGRGACVLRAFSFIFYYIYLCLPYLLSYLTSPYFLPLSPFFPFIYSFSSLPFVCLRQGFPLTHPELTHVARLASKNDIPISASQALGLKAGTTTLRQGLELYG